MSDQYGPYDNGADVETTKIGPRIREDVWADFKEICENRNGKEGTVGDELQRLMIDELTGADDSAGADEEQKFI